MGDALIERLNARYDKDRAPAEPHINPDGPEAASRIAELEAKLATAVGLLGELFEEGPVEVLFAGNPIPAMDLERRAKSFLASIQERT